MSAIVASPEGLMRRHKTSLLVGVLLFSLQACYLMTFYRAEIAPFPPTYYDQAVYLSESYALSWDVQGTGLATLARAPFRGVSAQGALFVPEGAALDLFAGGGRLSQLMLNFAALVLAELAVYGCVTALTGQAGLGWAAVGLLLAQHSLWNPAGGLFDFRIDFLALCLYGVAICGALLSDVFAIRRWTIATALCMALLVLNRFITSVYLAGLMITIIALLIALDRGKQRGRSSPRLGHAILCLAGVGVIVAPVMYASRQAIHDYYLVGHLIGPEKAIRAREAGVLDWIGALEYYPVSLARDHLGAPFGIGCLVMLLAMLAAMVRRAAPAGASGRRALLELPLVVASIAIPLAILTLDESKSPVVGGITCVPVLLLVALAPRWLGLAGPGRGRLWHGAGAVILLLGVVAQLDGATRRPLVAEGADTRQWAASAEWLCQDALERHLKSPRLFFDTISNPSEFTAFGYERTGVFTRFQEALDAGIFAFDAAKAMAALPLSDYVILTSGPKTGVYPFFESMARAEPGIRAWTREHLIARRRFELGGRSVEIYSTPVMVVQGASGEWLLAAGASVHLIPGEFKPGQIVALRGPDRYRRFMPTQPSVAAVATVDGHGAIAVPASFRRDGDDYEIDLDPAPLRFAGAQAVDIALTFDRYFVPSEAGINTDTRHLVVFAPTELGIRPGS